MSVSAELAETAGNANAFAAWAAVYDKQGNPLLALEERMLTRILPDSRGRDALDIGCGTGRWLKHCARGGAASLRGLDHSREMLDVAAGKDLPHARLVLAELPSVPLANETADFVLASFVLSYVQDMEKCASELARVIRAGGDLFISDMHPATAAALGWKRGFHSHGRTYELAVESRSIADLVRTLGAHGFTLAVCLEPEFGEAERELFRMYGRDEAWQQVVGKAPIFLLHFRRLPAAVDGNATVGFTLHGAPCALGAGEWASASVSLHNGVIASMVSEAAPVTAAPTNQAHNLALDGYMLFPGLVNAHDHLEFGLFPRLGSPPYRNATEWATDIQANEAETIRLHRRVPKEVRLWWGGLRNLLSGATTVCQHNPLHPVLQSEEFPVRVVEKYGWEHSLAFSADISGALRSTGADEPFFIHAGEGVDQTAAEELAALDALGALDSRSVLVHALALDKAGATLLDRRGSAVVICPSSNSFLFGKTHTPEQLRSIRRLALGSDSPLTAQGDLLDELRFAFRTCDLPAEQLYRMVTDEAARILRLHRGESTLRADAVGDLFAVRSRAGNPAEILTTLTWRDVELVIVGGQVRLASGEIFNRLPAESKQNLTSLMVEGESRWLRGPVFEMLEAAENVLGLANVRVGGLHVSRMEAEGSRTGHTWEEALHVS